MIARNNQEIGWVFARRSRSVMCWRNAPSFGARPPNFLPFLIQLIGVPDFALRICGCFSSRLRSLYKVSLFIHAPEPVVPEVWLAPVRGLLSPILRIHAPIQLSGGAAPGRMDMHAAQILRELKWENRAPPGGMRKISLLFETP